MQVLSTPQSYMARKVVGLMNGEGLSSCPWLVVHPVIVEKAFSRGREIDVEFHHTM